MARRAWMILLSGCLLVSGCTTVELEDEVIEGDRGEVGFQAIKKKLKWGYLLHLTQHGHLVGWIKSRGDRRVVLSDVKPGTYDVNVSGRRIEPFSVEIEVDAGRRSTVTVNIGSSAPAHFRSSMTLVGEFLLEVLKGVGIVALGALLLLLELVLEGC